MARLPLNTLPTFRAVARLQKLRAAALELHITHSAVSQQIKLLEDQIGFTLFDRSVEIMRGLSPGEMIAVGGVSELQSGYAALK